MAQFFGSYEHSLDPKGRVILPARFRRSFDTLCYVSQHLDRCLALWTPEMFDLQSAEMEARQGLSAQDRNMARVWAAGSHEVEIDRQGRVMLPQMLRDFAGLETQVLVVGILNRIELWDPAEWTARISPAEAGFTQPDLAPALMAAPPTPRPSPTPAPAAPAAAPAPAPAAPAPAAAPAPPSSPAPPG